MKKAIMARLGRQEKSKWEGLEGCFLLYQIICEFSFVLFTFERPLFQAEKRHDAKGKRRKRFVEGWVEFEKKSLAKRVAASLNNTAVGGKRRSAARESLWTMKYLSGFVCLF